MTFVSFVKEMLGEDMKDLGMKRKSGAEWYKLIDNSIYVNVFVREIFGGVLEIYCAARSLFSPFIDDYGQMANVNMIYAADKPMPQDFFSMPTLLFYVGGDEHKAKLNFERGREMFGIVKPVLAGIHDLESCSEAIEELGRLIWTPYYAKNGKEYKPFGYRDCPELIGYFEHIKLGRFDRAAEHLRNGLDHFETAHINDRLIGNNRELLIGPEVVLKEREKWQPYVDMAENRDTDKLYGMMRENYAKACDLLEAKYKIKIERLNF